MSDTPRTDEFIAESCALPPVPIRLWPDFARQLERELNAANERIKQLEAVVNDPEALWSNWLRGTVKLPSGIGDVRQYQERIKRLEDWKESALAVEREWNANAIATMLGGQPGESQREVIQREVPKLLERIKRLEEESESDWHLAQSAIGSCAEMSSRIQRLEEAGDALKAAGYFGGWADAVNNWIKSKEDKP